MWPTNKEMVLINFGISYNYKCFKIITHIKWKIRNEDFELYKLL